MRRLGFTLKQVLAAIGIILLLVGLTVPVGMIVRARALEAKCRANLAALGAWYNSQLATGQRVGYLQVKQFLLHDPAGKKLRCPLSGRIYNILPAEVQPVLDGEEFILRKNPNTLAYCECHIHPSARSQIVGYNPDGTPIVQGTGHSRWDDPVYLMVTKDGRVLYAEVYQREEKQIAGGNER